MAQRIETMRAVWPGSIVDRKGAQDKGAQERCDHPLPPSPAPPQNRLDAGIQPMESPTCACRAPERSIEAAGPAPHGFKS
jgi:hypothetical protein